MFPSAIRSRLSASPASPKRKKIPPHASSLYVANNTRQQQLFKKKSLPSLAPGNSTASRKFPNRSKAAASTISLENNDDVDQDDVYTQCHELRRNARQELSHSGNTRSALKALETAINLQQMREKGQTSSSRRSKSSEPLWQCVEEYILLLNREAVQSSETIEPPDTTQELFARALQWVCRSKSQLVKASAGGHPCSSCWKAASCPRQLPSVLRGLLLNNLAAHWKAMHKSNKDVVALLLHALLASKGQLSTVILYNLAVVFASAGHFDDAIECVARCTELAQRYLFFAEDKANSITELFYSDEGDLWVGSTVVEFSTTHLVYCHILVATISAWSGYGQRTTQHHCELASSCAAKYLASCHPLQRYCAMKVDSIKSSFDSALRSGSQHPTLLPQFPLVMVSGFQPSSLTFLRQWPLPIGMCTSSTYVAGIGVRVSTIIETLDAATFTTNDLTAFMASSRSCLSRLDGDGTDTWIGKLMHALQLEHFPYRSTARSTSSSGRKPGKMYSLTRSHREDTKAPASVDENVSDSATSTMGQLTPPPQEVSAKCVVSEMLCPVYERYNSLKNASRRAIRTSSSGYKGRRASFRVMQSMDKELQRFSCLLPLTEEMMRKKILMEDSVEYARYMAACAIQARWRQHMAWKEYKRRALQMQLCCENRKAGEVIWVAYKNYKTRQFIHKVWIHLILRRATPISSKLVLIQRNLQAIHSAVWLRQKSNELMQYYQRANAATIVIQRKFKQLLARRLLRKVRRAVKCIQLAWLATRARHEVAARQAALRVAAEERWWLQEYEFSRQVLYIQRWWRQCQVIQAARSDMKLKKKAVMNCVAEAEAEFAKNLGHWRTCKGLEWSLQKFISVLHGFKAREMLREKYKRVLSVRCALIKWMLRRRGKSLLDKLRRIRALQLARQRRREEVLAASMCIQRAVRLWLVRRHAASELKRVLRERRLEGETVAEMVATERERKLGQIRAYCAAVIQSAWRSHLCRREVLHHRRAVLTTRGRQQEQERMQCAAAMIQAVIRGFLVRCRQLAAIKSMDRNPVYVQ